MTAKQRRTENGLRKTVFRALETSRSGDPLSKVADIVIVMLICSSVIAVILESIKSLEAQYSEFFIMIIVMLLAASGIYHFEHASQPIDFGSIPAAMWWSFSTLTTVGYGDVTPVTIGGKVFGALVTVVGVGMVALPAGILASGFAYQLEHRSDQYQTRADEVLDDGVITADENSDLEALRLELGLGKHTVSQILDARMIQHALKTGTGGYCPHCESRVTRTE